MAETTPKEAEELAAYQQRAGRSFQFSLGGMYVLIALLLLLAYATEQLLRIDPHFHAVRRTISELFDDRMMLLYYASIPVAFIHTLIVRRRARRFAQLFQESLHRPLRLSWKVMFWPSTFAALLWVSTFVLLLPEEVRNNGRFVEEFSKAVGMVWAVVILPYLAAGFVGAYAMRQWHQKRIAAKREAQQLQWQMEELGH